MKYQTSKPYNPIVTSTLGARLNETILLAPLKNEKPTTFQVCADDDLFAANDEDIDKVFAVMAACPQHTFRVLTKAPEQAKEYLTADGLLKDIISRAKMITKSLLIYSTPFPLPNVWLGVSVSTQEEANERLPLLLQCPAAVRYVSCKPLLEDIYIKDYLNFRPKCNKCGEPTSLNFIDDAGWPVTWTDGIVDDNCQPTGIEKEENIDCVLECEECGESFAQFDFEGLEDPKYKAAESDGHIDWVIVSGETGKNARPMHPDWVRSLRDQCAESKTPFCFEGWGEWWPAGRSIVENKEMVLFGGEAMYKVGKTQSGRELDGKMHNGFPIIQP